jgi:hypothetical protein
VNAASVILTGIMIRRACSGCGRGYSRARGDRIGLMVAPGDLIKEEMHFQGQAARRAHLIIGHVLGHGWSSPPDSLSIRAAIAASW